MVFGKEIKESIKSLKTSFKFMVHSNRLRSLILYYGIMSGIFSLLNILRSSLLENIGFPDKYVGVVFALLGIITGIAAKNNSRFQKKFKNRSCIFWRSVLIYTS